MVKCENGLVEVNGSPENLSADLTCVIRGMKDILTKAEGEETAKFLIARSIELGLMTEDELKAEHEKIMKEFQRGLTATLAKAMLFDD